MITDQTRLIVNASLFLVNKYDDIYIVCLEEKKFALNPTAYFIATHFHSQSLSQIVDQLIEQFAIEPSKRNKIEIDCKNCVDSLIKNKILLISENMEE